MTDEFKLNREVARGDRAKAILDDEIYQEAWREVEAAIIQKWRECPIRDRDGAHELKLMLKLLEDVHGHINTVMQSGKMAAMQLEAEKKRKEQLRRIHPVHGAA